MAHDAFGLCVQRTAGRVYDRARTWALECPCWISFVGRRMRNPQPLWNRTPMATSDNSEFQEQIHYLIGLGRFRQAVEFLNLTSAYRFTALYRISSDQLQNLVIFDRQQPDQPLLDTVPLGDSYCVFVRDLKDAFIVADAADDSRVEAHPKRPTVNAYCGVPLIDTAGDVFGTVCHFDFAPVPENPATVDMLKTFAGVLDPVAASHSLERGVRQQVDALEAMLGLLIDACNDIADVTSAFEEFVSSIRQGTIKLNEPSRLATNARIDELLASLPARFAVKAHAVS